MLLLQMKGTLPGIPFHSLSSHVYKKIHANTLFKIAIICYHIVYKVFFVVY
jgi:hypothetical protein